MAVAFNLLLWPGPGLASRHILSFASRALDLRVGFTSSYEAYFLSSLFSRTAGAPQHETMADRASAVSHIHLNPIKFVGYVDETIAFTALATDFLDRTIQGVKFSWDESDNANKMKIDEAGRATFLQPGLARITCRAGSAVATAAVLIRPNHRPIQTDAEWRADQASLSVTGNTTGKLSQPGTSFLSSLLDRLAPTAYAQSGSYSGNDFAYDQLWSEPRNLVGSPPNRAIESTALGSVQPEGSNFNLAIPLVSLGGRGLAANLTLYYNSRVWGRHGSAVTFDPVASWPTPGFSLGFGRMIFYDPGWFMWIEPDGTRHYLGTGTYFGVGLYQTTDGSHIAYTGNASTGGWLNYPDGTSVAITVVNNRLLPTTISDRNGNYIQIAYKACYVDGSGFAFCDTFASAGFGHAMDSGPALQHLQYLHYELSIQRGEPANADDISVGKRGRCELRQSRADDHGGQRC